MEPSSPTKCLSSPPTQQNIDKVMRIMKCCCSINNFQSKIGQHEDEHIIKDAVLLSCGGNACRSCISNLNQKDLHCNYCSQTHGKEHLKVEELASNPSIDSFIDTFSKDLISLVKKDFFENTKFLEDSSFQSSVNHHIQLMDDQIDEKIDSLKKKLDTLGDELKRDLDRFRTSWKILFPNDKIQTLKQEFNKTPNFHDIQDNCIKLKSLINQCFDQFNSISFKATCNSELGLDLVGKINYPLRYDLNEVVSSNLTQVEEAKMLMRGVVHKNHILFTDYSSRDVKIMSREGTLMHSINPKNKLLAPLAICTNSKHDVFIGDCTHHQIFMFDSSFNFIKAFEKDLVKYPNSMVYDENSDLLYVTDYVENFVYAFDVKTNELVKLANCDSPSHIRLTHDSVVILSGTKFDGVKMIKGSNAIFILNKETLKLTRAIKLDKWLSPRGLYVDDCQTIITSALYATNHTDKSSSKRFLLLLNHNGNCLRSYELALSNLNDFVLYDRKKILACHENMTNLIEFE